MQFSQIIARRPSPPEIVHEVNLISGQASACKCTPETQTAIIRLLRNKRLRGPIYRVGKKGRSIAIKAGVVSFFALLREGFVGKPMDSYDFSETQFAAQYERLKLENAAHALRFKDPGSRPLKKGKDGTVMIAFVSKSRTRALVMPAAEARELHAQLGRVIAGQIPRGTRLITWTPSQARASG